MAEHKPTILAAVDAAAEPASIPEDTGEPIELGPDGWPVDSIDPGEPCPVCGSLLKWWDGWGTEHCQNCERETLTRAHALAEWAAAIRAGRGCPPDPRPGRLASSVPTAWDDDLARGRERGLWGT